ncbi:MAG: protein kinase, partial [Isosphaeraceae bacterium]|nr:protein kinase [Isosphaeraceae bacterium]
MTLDCPYCHRVLEFSGDRPSFCAYCGKPLGDPQLEVTTPCSPSPGSGLPAMAAAPQDTPTQAYTLIPRSEAAGSKVPERLAGYRLVRPLGQGGMGTVYEAEEASWGRKVALKILSPEILTSPEAVERFRQEGRLASTIAHARCVFVLAADEEAGLPYIVMELMPGETLQDLVAKEGPLPVERAVALILDVIEGLREAHRLGVIHRDVKPSNCFLEADGRVKVGDFGLSKSLTAESHLTRTGAFLGTPLYASPEQIKGEPVDRRTDVYSVAATLYFLLTGRPPFQGSDAAATLAKIVSDPLPPVRSLRPEIPAELDRVLLKGLERSRERRWPDLAALRDALIPFAPGRLAMGGVGLRLTAFLIDVHLLKFLILTVIGLVRFAASGGRWWGWLAASHPLIVGLDVAIYLISFGLIESLWGCSPGKWLVRLRVRGQGAGKPDLPTMGKRVLIFYGISALPWEVLSLAALARGAEVLS